jgi:prepilin-type processing-associated H-X9-DG protein
MANYKVIGGDHKQYGPVTLEDLRKWIAQGRLDAQNKVQLEGTDEWKSLGEIPELSEALRNRVPPPPLPSTPVSSPCSGLAVTSLVLGILGAFTCGITALFGLVLGIIAMVKVSNSRGALRGGGLALAGVIVSGIFVIFIPFFAALLLPALAAAHDRAREINCMSNEKQLAQAVVIYSTDHTNQFPTAATWCDAIQSAVGSDGVFKCPAVNSGSSDRVCNYAFNAKLSGMDIRKVDPQTVMIFESDSGWNANGGPELLPAKARHKAGRVFVIAFVDGHAEAVNQSRLNSLRWDP